MISVTNALNQITSYAYDLAGNKVSQTDANNHTTTYEFDKLNRRTKRTLPNTFFETYSYDSVGNLQTRKNFNGKTTTYAYDARNRVTSITPDPSIGGPGISFTYTASGRRATMTDASGSTSWTYDNRDRVLTKAAPAGTLTYTWDAHGNVASVLSSNTGGVSVGYAWDTLNRLQTVTDNRLSSATSYTYDDIGNLATITYPNGVVHSFTYDAKDQPSSLQLTKSASVLANYSQVFGFSGQKTSVTEASGRAVSYSYDAVYKLLSETITGATPAGSIGYTLDAVGNRLTRTSSVTGIAAQNLTYDAADRLTTDTYDNNGNTLTSAGNTYTYDFLDRLVTGPGVTMVYDGDGNRVSRTASGVTTSFVVDDFTPTGYVQVAEEVVSSAVVRRYTHGLQRISQTASAATSFYGYDGGLSVRQLFDGTGAITDTFDYDAFGNLVTSTGTTQNAYLYRGEQYEPTLGFYYLRARWMNAATGRFLTADEYEGEVEQPDSLHSYAFASVDPVNLLDATGFNSTEETALTTQIQNQAQITLLRTRVAGVTLNRVQQGAKITYDTVCCLDRAWSSLGLALDVISAVTGTPVNIPTNQALRLIDDVCQLGCIGNPKRPGKGGGYQHRLVQGLIGLGLESAGFGVQFEERFHGPNGGVAGSRYVDVTGRRNGTTLRFNVGKRGKSGFPVKRERDALCDLNKKGAATGFIPYN